MSFSLPLGSRIRLICRQLIWGSPGIGKSTLVKQYADQNQAELIDVRLSQYDAVDLRGLPDVRPAANACGETCHSSFTTWSPPDSLPFEGNSKFPDDRTIILFLDELLQADSSVQAAAFQLVLDRRVGEHKLKGNVRILAASNLEKDCAGGARLLAPLANRFMHIELKAHSRDWIKWARQNGVHEPIVEFLQYRPDLLDASAEAVRNRSKAFPTPRAWEAVSKLLQRPEHETWLSDGLCEKLVAGLVGYGAAAEFMAFQEASSNDVSISQVLASPAGCKIPTEPSRLSSVVTMLVRTVDADNAETVTEYINRLPTEYQMKFLADLTLADPFLVVNCQSLMAFQVNLVDSIAQAA